MWITFYTCICYTKINYICYVNVHISIFSILYVHRIDTNMKKKLVRARSVRRLQEETQLLFLSTLAVSKRKINIDEFVSKIQNKKPLLRKSRVLSSINHLKKTSYIEIEKKYYLKLSLKGQIFLKVVHQKSKKHWDHRFRIIFFDKVQGSQNNMSQMRKDMLDYGFFCLGRGVYLYPYHCDAFIDLLHIEYKLKKRLVYFIAQENESLIIAKKHFRLR